MRDNILKFYLLIIVGLLFNYKCFAIDVYRKGQKGLNLQFNEILNELNPRWQTLLTFGPGVQIIPTRLNTIPYVNNMPSQGKFEAKSQFTSVMICALKLSPIKTNYGSYEFTPQVGFNWLGKQSGHSIAFDHKITLGKNKLFSVFGFQHMRKEAIFNYFDAEDNVNGILYRSASIYNSKRKYFGVRFVYGEDNQNQLEALLNFEKFFNPNVKTSIGYSVYWSHNKTVLQLDLFPKHPAYGNKYSDNNTTPLPPNLPITSLFLQFTIRTKLVYERKY